MQRDLFESGDRDDLQNLVERARQGSFAFRDRDQQVCAQRRPDLDAHPVGRGAEEPAQSQVLFDPAKEQFYRPAAAINLSDDQSFQLESIGQEDKGLAGLRIDIADPPQGLGIGLLAVAGAEPDCLVAAQPRGFVDRPRFRDVKADAGLQPRHEEGPGHVHGVQALEVNVTPVHRDTTVSRQARPLRAASPRASSRKSGSRLSGPAGC